MGKTVEELQKELADTKAKAEENVKILQQKLSERDVEFKKTQEEIENLKNKGNQNSETDSKIEALGRTIESLNTQISTITTEKARESLAKSYPDILPDLLIGKKPEEIEVIVKKQREITMKTYDEKPSAHAPIYKDRNEAEEEIERVKANPKMNTTDKMTRIREIKGKIDEI